MTTHLGRLGAGVDDGAWEGGVAGCEGSWLRGTLPIRYQMPMLFSSLQMQQKTGMLQANAVHVHVSSTDVFHKHLAKHKPV